MANWTDILNSEVAAGAPISTALMTALRDNPTAIAEGDTATSTPYVAGAEYLLDTQDAGGNVGTVQLDTAIDIGDFRSLRALYVGRLGSGGTNVSGAIEVREDAGTWRAIFQLEVIGSNSNTNTIMCDAKIWNTDFGITPQTGTSNNRVWATGVWYKGNSQFDATDDVRANVTLRQSETSAGYSSYNEPPKEIRFNFTDYSSTDSRSDAWVLWFGTKRATRDAADVNT
jgi:hypothetical protein